MSPPSSFGSDDARRAWDTAAQAWEDFVESGADYYRWEVHGPSLLDACGDVNGLNVLDLGCGQGWFSRQLAGRGANVVGVDLSGEMLVHARRHEEQEPAGIRYVEADAAHIHQLRFANTIGLITGCMSFQDMADPSAVLASSNQVLAYEGRLVFSIPHPLSEMPYRRWKRDAVGRKVSLMVDRYFETVAAPLAWNMPRLEYRWETPRWRFTLAEWSSLVTGAGFVITGIDEPRPTDEQVARLPELEDCRRLPYFLVFQCVKAGQVLRTSPSPSM